MDLESIKRYAFELVGGEGLAEERTQTSGGQHLSQCFQTEVWGDSCAAFACLLSLCFVYCISCCVAIPTKLLHWHGIPDIFIFVFPKRNNDYWLSSDLWGFQHHAGTEEVFSLVAYATAGFLASLKCRQSFWATQPEWCQPV